MRARSRRSCGRALPAIDISFSRRTTHLRRLTCAPAMSPSMAAPRPGLPCRSAEPMVSVRQIPLQRRIVARLPREAVEVGQALLDEQPARRRGAGQILDRVVELEEERVRELSHVVETPLRPGLGGPRAARLPQRSSRPRRRARRERSAAAARPTRWRRTNLPARYAGRAAARRAPARPRGTGRCPRTAASAEAYRGSGSLRIAFRTIASRSPRSRRARPAIVSPRRPPVLRRREPPASTAVLGRSGSRSQTTRISSSGSPVVTRYGWRPESSSYSTTPSE